MSETQPRPTSTVTPEILSPPPQPPTLLQPSHKKKSKPIKAFRLFRSVFRSFPILTPVCKLPAVFPGSHADGGAIHGGTRMTGTLFGYRKARVSLAIQDTPRSIPTVLLELPIPTSTLQREMATGLVRIALECEKRAADKTKIIDEPVWTMYCNGKKTGYGTKREPFEEDLNIIQMLRAVSMGAGVLPGSGEGPEGELTYMRARFERVVGSKDSEAFYMLNPDGNSGPELSVFFVRI